MVDSVETSKLTCQYLHLHDRNYRRQREEGEAGVWGCEPNRKKEIFKLRVKIIISYAKIKNVVMDGKYVECK